MSKYYASGSGSAVAYIAKWDPIFASRPRLSNSGAALNYNSAYGSTGSGSTSTGFGATAVWQELSMKNAGETMADFTFWVGYETDRSTAVTASSSKLATVVFTAYTAPVGYAASNDLTPTVINNGDGTWKVKEVEPGQSFWVQLHFSDEGATAYSGAPMNANNVGLKCKLFLTAVQVD
ncbi:MAG: hypothetical protein LBG83_05360 [Oscillospiraceae bacterium]|nr:hypothetical protein [Oscillospiraceae bacterium]